mmetsp:Transcript_59664/g.129732  ORF Transcript_59664/g.129732 Transcript_59664/m.129732 type:complete len:207 (-) Transcript_59664:32-652(-)
MGKTSTEPRFPTVAVSDAFMASCAAFAGLSAWRGGTVVSALGFWGVAAACCAGVLRFGFSPDQFRPFNENLAAHAGRVSIPLIGLGVAHKVPALAPYLEDQIVCVGVLSIAFAASLGLNHPNTELYTTIISAAGILTVIAHSYTSDCLHGVVGGVLFVVGGLAIGADRHRSLMGVRRENLFHYCLGSAFVLMSRAPGLNALPVPFV